MTFLGVFMYILMCVYTATETHAHTLLICLPVHKYTNTHIYTYMYVYLCMQCRQNVPIIYLCTLTIWHNLTGDLRKRKQNTNFVWLFLKTYYDMKTMEIIHYFPFFLFFLLIMSFTEVALSDPVLKTWALMVTVKSSLCKCRLQNSGLTYPTEGKFILKSKKCLWENFIISLKKILGMGLWQETAFLMVSRGKSHLGEVTPRLWGHCLLCVGEEQHSASKSALWIS